jgi:hypothetical protein
VSAAAALFGFLLLVYALATALYIVILTVVVAVCVWPLLARRARRRNTHTTTRVVLLCAATTGFWIVTTTAVRFADSSGAEDGAGATSLVSVSPWGPEADPSSLLKSGLLAAIGVTAVMFGIGGYARRTE